MSGPYKAVQTQIQLNRAVHSPHNCWGVSGPTPWNTYYGSREHARDAADILNAAYAAGREGERAEMTAAARDVLAERARHITAEGWSLEHDDRHEDGSMANAAAVYALSSVGLRGYAEKLWPWEWNWWKPKDRRTDLVRSGALILAEIERLDRALLAQADKDQT